MLNLTLHLLGWDLYFEQVLSLDSICTEPLLRIDTVYECSMSADSKLDG